jgi:transcriptional regulator of acetoin/glycerol metabolism
VGRFREDLYYRVNVLHLQLPPLRGSGSRLARLFVSAHASDSAWGKDLHRDALGVSGYRWPGNVRGSRT